MPAEMGEDTPAAIEREVEWEVNHPLVRRIDDYWCTVERGICGVMFLVMSVLVFAAVTSSIFANRHEWIDAVTLFGFVYLGCRTRVVRDGERRLSQLACLGIAAALTAAIAGGVVAYTNAYPGGITQAPAIALCLMLWVALLGASVTTHERSHLALEFGEQLWPKRYLHVVRAAARALTSACCLVLFYLSYLAVSARYHMWDTGDHLADLVPGLDLEWLPQWLVLIIIPYTFAAMALRFTAQGYTVATGTSKPEEEQLPT